ncbi:MAG: diaminopimelate decarboxylase [Alphaproteobacteria bacterium]|nr:diaminopimelate decarboxylase [Alphaproteobacteria bacterium]
MSSGDGSLGAPRASVLADSGFSYANGALCAEGAPLTRIAAAVGTPFYCYSSAALEAQYRRFAAAFARQEPTIYYAIKANHNLAVIRVFARLGAGADVVSEGELRRALAAGVPPGRIVFSGVGKTREELAFALSAGIHQINVESEPELEALSEVAAAMGLRAPIALRVNPDIDARTHAKISTGKKENKFGIDLGLVHRVARRAAALPGIALEGLAVHIGSQLTDLAPYRLAFARLADLARALRAEGHALTRLDLGGGLGIAYRDETPPPLAAYAEIVQRTTGNLGMALGLEPGRALVGNAGILVARVVYRKEGATRSFLVLDAAMNDLIRPALYDAWHEIVPVEEPPPDAQSAPFDIVGPICESGDTFASQRVLPRLEAGALVAILSAGAYGAAMSSIYNSRRLVPEVLVRGDDFAVVRPRPTFDDMLSQDRIPGWLE